MSLPRRLLAKSRAPGTEPAPRLNADGSLYLEILDGPMAKRWAKLTKPPISSAVAALRAADEGDEAELARRQEELTTHGWRLERIGEENQGRRGKTL